MTITTGRYQGFYKYDNERINQKLGRQQTFFEIDIAKVEGDTFYGIVKEEPVGQPGTGTITGIISANKISFIKQMAIASGILPNGQRRTHNTRHPKIYYEGIRTDDKFIGTWKIKFGFIFVGFFPIPIPPTSGTWEMKRADA